MDTQQFDVVIMGGGVAGLSAGTRAAELGLRTIIVEKGAQADYPCNSRYSGGIFHIAHRDPRTPAEELQEHIRSVTRNTADPDLSIALSLAGGGYINWLQDKGVRFMQSQSSKKHSAPIAIPVRRLVGGLDWKGRGPDVLLRQLTQAFAARGGTLMLGTEGTRLVMREGRCCGLEVRCGNTSTVLEAQAVVLADGGFQANLELVEQNIAPKPAQLIQRGAGTGNGAGLTMAREAGAASTEMASFYGHLLSRDAFRNDMLWPYPQLDELAVAGIMVDTEGRRFADEGLGGVYLANVVARRADPLSTCAIFDADMWNGAGRYNRIPPNPQMETAGATIHRAGSIAELAAMIGVPAATLCETVETYNAAHKAGTLQQLPTPRSSADNPAAPLLKAPFFAIPACSGITYTMGGIRIDTHSRVLREDGSAISGLYASGATTGGLEGGPTARYVGGLCRSGTFGKIAAEHIAAAGSK